MSLYLFLNNKSEEGISSRNIGVRSPTKMNSKLGVLKLDCKGVNEVIGVPISIDCCCSVVLEASVAGVKGYVSYHFFKKASS
jgi:hypothetical protein